MNFREIKLFRAEIELILRGILADFEFDWVSLRLRGVFLDTIESTEKESN